FSCTAKVIFFFLFYIFVFLSLTFDIFIIMCFDVGFFGSLFFFFQAEDGIRVGDCWQGDVGDCAVKDSHRNANHNG
ncbi:hypothetical protein KZ861_34855, partial [Pseudomonas aeruginosa]|uniref:hypothetical protein n=1 Tax=Pseudomonas aeruginosa TaxID=287 RepID=UPI001CA55ED9